MVGVGLEVFVDEEAVSFGAGSFLEGKGDEVPETAAREGVLIGEEAVVGGELGLGSAFGGFGEEEGGEFSGEGGGDGFLEKEPDVGAVAGAGFFQRGGNLFLGAGGEVGEGVVGPAWAVEIDGEEVAGFVEEHGVDSDDEISGEVTADHFVGDGEPGLVGAGVTFDAGLFADAPNPFVSADRGVSRFAGFLADEAMRVDFFAATKERAEEGDFFRGGRGVAERHRAG